MNWCATLSHRIRCGSVKISRMRSFSINALLTWKMQFLKLVLTSARFLSQNLFWLRVTGGVGPYEAFTRHIPSRDKWVHLVESAPRARFLIAIDSLPVGGTLSALNGRAQRIVRRQLASATRDWHVAHNVARFTSIRDWRATILAAPSSAGTRFPVPKYISSGV